jgi:hypothetical protein
MTDNIEQMEFPELGTIRKGMPKKKVIRKDKKGNEYDAWTFGDDLKEFFRVSFAPGTEEEKEKFKTIYPDSYKVFGDKYAENDGFLLKKIHAIMPCRDVSMAWKWANIAYDGSTRKMAEADDTHYITKRDPTNGKYIVKNGLPYTPFEHGETITYMKGEKEIVLPIKTNCSLILFLPDLGEWGSFTFKSTAYYDRIHINKQLATIQMLANLYANGNVGGVPFYIYRSEKQLVWNKPDGSAMPVKKWLINVKADSRWVESMTRKMSNFQFTDDYQKAALLPILEGKEEIDEAPIQTFYNPDEPDDENLGENVIDVISEDVVEEHSVDTDFPPVVEKTVIEKVYDVFKAIKENNEEDKIGAFSIFEKHGNKDPREIKDENELNAVYTEIKEYQNKLNQKENK